MAKATVGAAGIEYIQGAEGRARWQEDHEELSLVAREGRVRADESVSE